MFCLTNVLALLLAVSAAPSHLSLAASSTAEVAEIERVFNAGRTGWLENLVLRPNGRDVITTHVNSPFITLVEPSNNVSCTLARFSDANDTTGIVAAAGTAESYFFSSLIQDAEGPRLGGGKIWHIDMQNVTCASLQGTTIHPKLIASLPRSLLPNGLALIQEKTLLSSDSSAGLIWRIDVVRGTVDVFLNDTNTAGRPDPATGESIFVNGIRSRGRHVYFTNTLGKTFSRVRFGKNGYPSSPVEPIARLDYRPDDFALAPRGKGVFIAAPSWNTVTYEDGLSGETVNLTSIQGPTAVIRSVKSGRTVLYVSYTGGEEDYRHPPTETDAGILQITMRS